MSSGRRHGVGAFNVQLRQGQARPRSRQASAIAQVEVGVKTRVTQVRQDRLSEGQGRAPREAVARASSEVDVTKCVRGCRRGQRSVQRWRGRQRVHSSRKPARPAPNRIGRAKLETAAHPATILHFTYSRTPRVSSWSACYGDIQQSLDHQVCSRGADGIDGLSILFLALVAMTNRSSNLPGNRDLRCVAATVKGPDLRTIRPTEIRAPYDECARERDNNYFRTAEWYATR